MGPLPDKNALVAGMTMVPGLFSRNRMFALFEREGMRQARERAAFLRGMSRQLIKAKHELRIVACEHVADASLGASEDALGIRLHYLIPSLRFERQTSLTLVEYACVATLCERAGAPCLALASEEREAMLGALKRLSARIPLGAQGGSTEPWIKALAEPPSDEA